MVADIVTVLIGDVPNLEVVVRVDRIGDCLNLEPPPADLVICSVAEAELVSAWKAALDSRALPAILNLGADSTRGDLYAVYPVQRKLEDISARSLLQAVDDHVRSAHLRR